jgi:alpha-mannosidase
LSSLHNAANELIDYSEEEARRARALLAGELAKVGGTPSLKISAIGHAHIDLAWLWPLRETIRKGARSFSTVLALMERYPDYVFGASQPQLYQWMKDFYPLLYEKIKAKIAEGRWETQGAMWIEPDTNLAGGEALVRQVLYGKRFFREEFGTNPKMLWLPDVFGYTAALPQILKKAGVDYFLTIKLSWNTMNTFPHHTFFWQGIDGSRILAHMPPEGTYNSSAAPRALMAAEKTYADKAVSEHCALLFGIGDGGGGPGSEHLERLAREQNLDGLAPVAQEPMETFFQRLSQEANGQYKTWVGELYLEKHQGTYTTQARNKRYNRKIELALRELELVATLAHLGTHGMGTVYRYPTQELDAIWKEVLLYQFHDILPGSSITRVYDESLARYQQISEQIEHLYRQAQQALMHQEQVKAVTVFNPLSWERHEWLQVEDRWQQVIVPSMGYAVIDAAEVTQQSIKQQSTKLSASPSPSPTMLENDRLRLQFAPDGAISSIFDKEHRREVLAAGALANRLALYHDEGDAWDFAIDYDERPPRYFKLTETTAHIDGPQAVVEQQYQFGQSTLRQQIVLLEGSRRIDFVTSVDWREQHKMLRTSFPAAVAASEAICDIQFGSIKRPTHRNTSWDMARYEICAHKWVDLSQGDYGVALLNDSKYGHKILENVLDLNLLRSPGYPDPQADRAYHEFTYALYPHIGNHITGNVIQAGYELNVPLRMVAGTPNSDVIMPDAAFAQVDAKNVIIETVKKAEEGDDIILRLYEATGATTSTTLTLSLPLEAVWKTNLLEELEEKLAIRQNTVELVLQPFEILTLCVQVAPF